MSVFALMKKLGILNFIVVQVELETLDKLTVWTKNQFTHREDHFLSDHRPVAQLFPDKLHDLNGYQFVLYGEWDYPYIMPYVDGVYGVLPKFFDIIIHQRCNGTTSYSQNAKHSHLVDSRFNRMDHRLSFEHTLYFREQSGWYLVCPERKERDFLQPLLKPFSMGIWIVIAALFVTCWMLQFLFPMTYRYDLVGITFFGGGGTEYEHPFQFRIVTFTLIVLLFFLSEAYNTKLISLMTFSKFYKQPETLEEFARSDYRILAVPSSLEMSLGLKHNFLSLSETRREERRLGPRKNEVYCSIMNQGIAFSVVGIGLENYAVPLYMIREPVIVDRSLVQFNRHSPFYDMFQMYFDRFNDAGLWINLIDRCMHALGKVRPHLQGSEQFQEVIFYFNDLTCIWILVIAGWLVSGITFVFELIWWKFHYKFGTRNAKSEQFRISLN
ncbi:hypothetical protein ZHAS_00013745 [Anopheles sinensis]|uniref:Ionotropic glutamate receptor L-glutamate and glycine-binding domain-containing protein n=1 Tax=Anopheles sinensis TaxID=74873 RepID=A0A084W6C6_ANOSI|nr:hypothetical protein ZHAS_00013745 [Anopheles sinensis]